ncbi:MAG: zinc-dependent dehydrogenase [Dehalococcoidia bacterium]
MRVAMYYSNRDVRLEELPLPQIGPGELLVKVITSGICGSDVMEWYRARKAPLVLGHEIAGDIVEVGEDVEGLSVGDRVFVSHHVPCGECHYCLHDNETVCETLRSTNFDPGGFAEFIRVPQINVKKGTFRLPENMSYDEGTFIEPLACVVRGQRRAGMETGKSVLVIGSGISGILHLQLAQYNGARCVMATDISRYRLDMARRIGADAVVHAEEDVSGRLREINEGRLADLVIICAGAEQAVRQGLQSVERGGTILLFAPPAPEVTFPIELCALWREGITLTTSYAGSPRDIAEAIEIIGSQNINVRDMITHRLGLGETGLGFQLTAEAGDSLKVIIEPQR